MLRLSLEHISELLNGIVETVVYCPTDYNDEKKKIHYELFNAEYISAAIDDDSFSFVTTDAGKDAFLRRYCTADLSEAVMRHNLALCLSPEHNRLMKAGDIVNSSLGREMVIWFNNIY